MLLYGWYTVDNEASVQGLRQFLSLLVASFGLDIVWLYSWSGKDGPGAFVYFLVLVNMLLKPVALLAGLGNLRQRGAATFGGLEGGWSGLPGSGGGPGEYCPRPPSRPKR